MTLISKHEVLYKLGLDETLKVFDSGCGNNRMILNITDEYIDLELQVQTYLIQQVIKRIYRNGFVEHYNFGQ